ncbi:MAG: ATP-binding protein [Verrucomicrobiota bacterium]
MTVLKFGIQEKTALLVMVVAVVSAVSVALIIQRISTEMVEQHETVDLNDEANLRAWEIIDQFNGLREDLTRIASSREIRDLVYDNPDRERIDLTDKCSKLCKQWPMYLSVELADNRDTMDPIALIEDIRLDGTERDRLIEEFSSQNPVVVSKMQRVEAEVSVPSGNGSAEWRPKWLPLAWGCARIDPPSMYDGPTRYLVFAMEIVPVTSPRHLMFMVDAEGDHKDEFIVHPNMSISYKFGEDDMFAFDVREEFVEGAQLAEIDPLDRVQRVTQLLNRPLNDAYFFYFREGSPTEEFRAALDKKRTDDPLAYRRGIDAIQDQHVSMARRLGGLGNSVELVRMLARDPSDLRRGSSKNPSFLQQVEDDLSEFVGLPQGTRVIQWNDIVVCQNCHVSFVNFYLETEDGPHKYLLMYAAFHEEFIGAIRQEIQSGLSGWIFWLAIGSAGLAFGVALLFIRPLQLMTKTAQDVVNEKGALHDRIADLSAHLPTDRNDEIGDIAKASQRLFDEVILSQEHLEGRVRERTAELEEAYEKLESLGKEKDVFLANVSHELRTPLTAVSGFLQLLKRKKQLDDKSHNYVDKALSSSATLKALIDDILDFQKIVMGGMTLHADEFDVPQLLNDVEDSMQFDGEKNANQFKFSCDSELKTMNSDQQRLRQVLANLLSNACKFTKDGVISVDASAFEKDGEPWARFRVKDTGRGMSEEEQEKLFVRFNTNRTANESGTGLGLVICEGVCKLMGGSLVLEHSAPGEGSTFVAEVPTILPNPEDAP